MNLSSQMLFSHSRWSHDASGIMDVASCYSMTSGTSIPMSGTTSGLERQEIDAYGKVRTIIGK